MSFFFLLLFVGNPPPLSLPFVFSGLLLLKEGAAADLFWDETC